MITSRDLVVLNWATSHLMYHMPKLESIMSGSGARVEVAHLSLRFVIATCLEYPKHPSLRQRMSNSTTDTPMAAFQDSEFSLIQAKLEHMNPTLRLHQSPLMVVSSEDWQRLTSTWDTQLSMVMGRLYANWRDGMRYPWKKHTNEHIVQMYGTAERRVVPVVFDLRWLMDVQKALQAHLALDAESAPQSGASNIPQAAMRPYPFDRSEDSARPGASMSASRFVRMPDGGMRIMESPLDLEVQSVDATTTRRKVISCNTCGCKKVSHTPCGMCGNFQTGRG